MCVSPYLTVNKYIFLIEETENLFLEHLDFCLPIANVAKGTEH